MSLQTFSLLSPYFQLQIHSHTMPDSTSDSASTIAPPTTTSPDSDDEFFKLANVTTRYQAEDTPLGTIICSKEVDGMIKNIHVVRTHSHPTTDCEAFLIVRDNSLRGNPTWLVEDIRWRDPSAAPTPTPSQGPPVTASVTRTVNSCQPYALQI